MKRMLLLLLVFISCNNPGKEKQVEQQEKVSLEENTIKEDTLLKRDSQKVIPTLIKRIPDYDTTKWTDITFLDSTIVVDMKYATNDNFVQEKMYDCGRCFLRPEVALALRQIQDSLQSIGLGLKVYDCFRPRPIQQKLWEKVPDPRFVSDPKKGSMHNRGAAVDLTLVSKDGKELDMGTHYDYFGKEAYPGYTGLPDSVLANRRLLSEIMLSNGFKAISTEWWHYSYTGKFYELSDMLWNCQ